MFISDGMIAYANVLAQMHADCFDKPWHTKDFNELLALPTTLLWLDEKGFLLCSCVGDEMEILTIGVLPLFRNQGRGAHLLNEMISYASVNGIVRVFLEVSDDNLAAQALYRKKGFCISGRRKNYYKTPNGFRDAICMVKETAPF